jgi:hypothetical protein
MATKKSSRGRQAAKPSRIDSVRELVGVLTDAEVAAKAGVTSSAVHQYRQRHGIKPALPQGTTRRAVERRRTDPRDGAATRGRRPARAGLSKSASVNEPTAGESGDRRRSKIDHFRDLVGVLTDPEVAEKAGVTRTAVQMYRKKHGIPPAGPPGDPAVARARAPVAAAPKSSPAPVAREGRGRLFAFRVTVYTRSGEAVRIAVAEDAAVAAERARSLGDVLMVERLGEAM